MRESAARGFFEVSGQLGIRGRVQREFKETSRDWKGRFGTTSGLCATYLSPGWLAIDPNFDPLRKNPRFQELVAGAK